MKRSLRRFLMILAALPAMVCFTGGAGATLMIMPIMTVFTDRDRSADITVVNTVDQDATFRIGWRYQRQNELGSYDILTGPLDPEHDPAKMLVFSPRQVFLPGNSKQKIRVSLRRPPDLPDGEYRIHLLMQRIGKPDAPVKPRNQKGPQGITPQLSMNIGYALPVLIRKGKYDAAAAIVNPKFIPAKGKTPPELEMYLNRTGKYSTLGAIRIYWTPPGQAEKEIGRLNNVNVWSETSRRQVRVALKETNIVGGTVRVTYIGDGPDKGVTFDEKAFPVGG